MTVYWGPDNAFPDNYWPDDYWPKYGAGLSKLNIIAADPTTEQPVHIGDEGNSLLVSGNHEVKGNVFGGTVHSDALDMTMEESFRYAFMMA